MKNQDRVICFALKGMNGSAVGFAISSLKLIYSDQEIEDISHPCKLLYQFTFGRV